jgi:hypothetical protein
MQDMYPASILNENHELSKLLTKYEKTFKINCYVNDGFEKVCDVVSTKDASRWYYVNIDESLMYADHRSWVYFVVVDGYIVKCGETGNPLGIKSGNWYKMDIQPLASTKSRFGRLTTGKETDQYLRETIIPKITNGSKVELWAKKCPVTSKQVQIAGNNVNVEVSIHKDLELVYLQHFKTEGRRLPSLNKATK